MGFSPCLLLALLGATRTTNPSGHVFRTNCAHSDRWASAKTSRAVAWQAQRPLSDRCSKEILGSHESRPAPPPCSPSPLTGEHWSRVKPPCWLLTRWRISFLEPGKAVQIHQIFRLHVCGWAKGKMCLMPELYPLVMGKASALFPRESLCWLGKTLPPHMY